ncbi:IS3 family transposase [Streptomyces sp. NPDC055085]
MGGAKAVAQKLGIGTTETLRKGVRRDPPWRDDGGIYYAHHKRQAAPAARTVRDAELKTLITQAYEANYRVYGARKIWRHLNRQGLSVARCTVERLMRDMGITGAVCGKKVITTIPDGSAQRAPDLVGRDFVATAPNAAG